jgi:hypothetical protein
MARPRKAVDPAKVQAFAAQGCTSGEIGSALDVSGDTIERRYAVPLVKGRHQLNRLLKSKMLEQIDLGNTAVLIFALKSVCGLREPREDAVTVNVSQTAITLTPQQLKANLTELRQAVREEAKRFVLN